MADRIVLESDEAVVEIVPRLGGSLMAFDLKRGGERVPILRPWDGTRENPRAYASSPMVPWFNRISGGGIPFEDTFYPIAPNDPLDPFPLHGDGWTSPWQVREADGERAVLTLRSQAIPPFDYEATQVFTLAGATLDVDLRLTHLGADPFPYGMGQHPWFPRTKATTLQFRATGMWVEQPPHFAASERPVAMPPEWDFNRAKTLPEGFLDNGYAGWDGHARIEWPDRGVAVSMESLPSPSFCHAYSLDADCPYFCFEPVTNPNNAFAKPGGPAVNGLKVLAHGEHLTMPMRLKAATL